MKITFDPDADAAFIYLVPTIERGEVARTHMCDLEVGSGAVILAFDSDDRILGVEVLGAGRLLPSDVLETAERPR